MGNKENRKAGMIGVWDLVNCFAYIAKSNNKIT